MHITIPVLVGFAVSLIRDKVTKIRRNNGAFFGGHLLHLISPMESEGYVQNMPGVTSLYTGICYGIISCSLYAEGVTSGVTPVTVVMVSTQMEVCDGY